MISIKDYLKRQFKFSSLLFIGLFISLILLLYFAYDLNLVITDTKNIFNRFNNYIRGDPFDESIIKIVNHYVKDNKLKEYLENNDKLKFEEEIRRIIPILQNIRNAHVNRIIVFLQILVISLALIFIFMFLMMNLLYKHVNNYIEVVKFMIKQFNSILLDEYNKKKSELEGNENKKINFQYIELQNIKYFYNLTLDLINLSQKLISISPTISVESFIDKFGDIFCSDKYQDLLPCDRFSFALYRHYNDSIVAFHAKTRNYTNIYLTKGYSQKFSDTSLIKIIEEKKEFRIIDNLEEWSSESANLLLKEGIKSNITVPVIVNQKFFGFIFFASKKSNAYNYDHGKIANFFTSIIMNRFFYSFSLQKTLSVFGEGITNIVEFKDTETADHTRRVSQYSSLIAEALREYKIITPEKAYEIVTYAPLHDIGKIGIPDSILFKSSKLNEEEWEIMKTHTIIGGNLLKKANSSLKEEIGISLLDTAYNIIVDHHEWWDGSGYPEGKKGNEISIEGQIVAIADVFDALTTKRPYKDIIPFDESIEIIKMKSGIHFNPELVNIFISEKNSVYEIYQNLYLNLLN
ncbi:MAG: HD domain-containing phosphohydrolase [Exilispira sp.]